MSLVGRSCLIDTGSLELRPAIIRASSQPLFLNADFSNTKVLLEWCDGEPGQREWISLNSHEDVQGVYVEKFLRWAKRILPSEQHRAVAWPARAYVLLCGSSGHHPESIAVEYLCDKERAHLFLQDTKELLVPDARLTLQQHTQMLQELSKHEERENEREALTTSSALLTGHAVRVHQMQGWIHGVVTAHNLQTRELTVQEDLTRTTHTVNPFLVHVELLGGGLGERGQGMNTLHRTSSLEQVLIDSNDSQHSQPHQHQSGMGGGGGGWPHHHTESLSSLNSQTGLGSPQLLSPTVSDCQSPHFGPRKSVGMYRTLSTDLQHRSTFEASLPLSMQSEPNLARRSSADHLYTLPSLSASLNFDLRHEPHTLSHHPSVHIQSPPSLHEGIGMNGAAGMLSHPPGPAHTSPMGSATHLERTPSNSSLSDPSLPNFTPSEFLRQERSKSLGNINMFDGVRLDTVGTGGRLVSGGMEGPHPLQKRRSSCEHNPSFVRGMFKRARFDALPTIPQGKDLTNSVSKTLPRSASNPAICHLKSTIKHEIDSSSFAAGGGMETESASGSGSADHVQEDELDMIEQIINKDESINSSSSSLHQNLRSQSLSHLPGEFSSSIDEIGGTHASLPSLPHASSIHILHNNYESAPNFSRLSPLSNYDTASLSKGKVSGATAHGGHDVTNPAVGDFEVDSVQQQQQQQQSSDTMKLLQSHQSTSGFDAQMQHYRADPSTPILGHNYKEPPSVLSQRRDSDQSTTYSDLDTPTPRFDRTRLDSGHATMLAESNTSFLFPTPSSTAATDSSNPTLNHPPKVSPGPKFKLGVLLSNHPPELVPSKKITAPLVSAQPSTVVSPALIMQIENRSVGGGVFVEQPCESDTPLHAVRIAPAAEVLPSVVMQDNGGFSVLDEIGELAIAKVLNEHVPNDKEETCATLMEEEEKGGGELRVLQMNQHLDIGSSKGVVSSLTVSPTSETGKKSHVKPPTSQREKPKRSRGRPRLTEDEKLRRKELRDIGLMKRSKRRTKEEVAQWRADKILSPAKRGRKPGSGKKNIVKAASGKVVFVNVDLSKYPNGSVLLQNGFCRAFAGVSKCLECNTCDGDLPATRYCRFLEFRKLRIVDNATPVVAVEGFADYTDVNAQDLVPWTPLKAGYSGMDEESATFVLSWVMKHFISLATEEAKAIQSEDATPVWKRAVQGLRELCDTCDTTLFNFHLVCQHCGFCVCPLCYQQACDSDSGSVAVSSVQAPWPVCVVSNQPHRSHGLILAQIIPANVLADVVVQALQLAECHKMRLPSTRELDKLVQALGRQEPKSRFSTDGKKGKGNKNGKQPSQSQPQKSQEGVYLSLQPSSLPHALRSYDLSSSAASSPSLPSLELPHSCSNGSDDTLQTIPVNAPHLWLCDETLPVLLDPTHEDNLAFFQKIWEKGQPVVVAGVNQQLDSLLWTPARFESDFGEELADLVDCRAGLILLQVPCRTFWAGFNNMAVRLLDITTKEPRLLKLKDWPTVEDFSEKLPQRFADFMKALPFPEYTRRDGKLNMVASLPDFFAKPDLGPKMYNAYGSPAYPHCGTTNLHLDISDAVNVMVYCSIPPSLEEERERAMVYETVAEECCPSTVQRLQDSGLQVGAIWHIYAASHADKIRTMLRKVLEERGVQQLHGSDPIHDQCIYLDAELRQRLYTEYGVRGWTIAQCVGDAIFIPAGAPHQVRNLSSCIKVAEDFVSPEHVSECLKLTEEFRQLSDRHANHEDKLQMKNIIYHSVKDSVGILRASLKQNQSIRT